MGIQAGIQAMHVIPELYEKFKNPKWFAAYSENLSEWATKHKTIMHLRTFGGNDSIEELYPLIAAPARALNLPFAIFREPELRNTATACGVVVPTEYYSVPEEQRDYEIQQLHNALDKLPFAH
jgi:hypothetical protein